MQENHNENFSLDTFNRKIRYKDKYLEEVCAGKKTMIQDGATGTYLEQLARDEKIQITGLSDLLCLTNPDLITRVHSDYVRFGAMMVTTNTFNSNPQKLPAGVNVQEIYQAAANCARAANPAYIGASIGPTGSLMQPIGDLSFNDAYDIFAAQVKAASKAGVDIICIETMTNLLEAKVALLAAKENCDLPIFVTMSFEEDGRTFMGTTPEIAALALSRLGASAIGINCSLGPVALVPMIKKMIEVTDLPVIFRPNAGIPTDICGEAVFDVSPEEYARQILPAITYGASIIGGCCGTTPEFIRQASSTVLKHDSADLNPREKFQNTVATSATFAVVAENNAHEICIIGERINPTGKARLKQALKDQNYDYILGQAIDQIDAGAQILDVNVGSGDVNEAVVLTEVVKSLQGVVANPLMLDSSDTFALEAAARIYNGLPIINSVNGKTSNMHEVLPIVAHYGCSVIALTLDEEGIPFTSQDKLKIARRIVNEAKKFNIDPSRIIVDCLVMALATNQPDAAQTMHAISLVKNELGCKTCLGVSNSSFGMPNRELLTSTFMVTAFAHGLDFPIINPNSKAVMDSIAAYKVINAQDSGARDYVEKFSVETAHVAINAKISKVAENASDSKSVSNEKVQDLCATIEQAVLSGREAQVHELVKDALESNDALEVINNMLIPALDKVGDKFESGELFLPSMMASAQAVKAGFEVIADKFPNTSDNQAKTICIATVQGDIHDIGKNIVSMLLSNYGFRVIDLGRDVAPEKILDVVQSLNIKLVGLSALMTTTVKSMEKTIALLQANVPECEIIVGGAVLNRDYAAKIGANHYAKDAIATVRLASKFFAE